MWGTSVGLVLWGNKMEQKLTQMKIKLDNVHSIMRVGTSIEEMLSRYFIIPTTCPETTDRKQLFTESHYRTSLLVLYKVNVVCATVQIIKLCIIKSLTINLKK